MHCDIKHNPEYDPILWFVAMEDQEIAGYAICRKRQNQLLSAGHIDNLGVRLPWRRRGLGPALLHHSLNASYQRGISDVRLEIDADSLTGAARLYEKVGMRSYLTKAIYQKELRAGAV